MVAYGENKLKATNTYYGRNFKLFNTQLGA